MLFYDLSDRKSFEHVHEWLKLIHDHTEDGIVILLIGNKYDLIINDPSKREVSEREIDAFANEHGIFHRKTSALTGHNVSESFQLLIDSLFYF